MARSNTLKNGYHPERKDGALYLFSIYFTLAINIEYNLVYIYLTIAKYKMNAN